MAMLSPLLTAFPEEEENETFLPELGAKAGQATSPFPGLPWARAVGRLVK